MSELEARRKALAAEAEVYRQTLKLEIQNIRLYSQQMKRSYRSVSPRNPLFMVLAPLVTSLLGRTKPARKFKFLSTVMMGYQMFNRFAPLLPAVIGAFKKGRASGKAFREEQKTPAATI
jgi:hypothetical protein